MPHQALLVADGDADSRNILEHALASAGYRVTMASTAGEALALMRDDRPALVVSELYLPCGGHHCLLPAMRADAALRDIPVLVLTSKVLPEDREWAARWHCAAFVPKPTSLTSVLGTIGTLLAGPARDESPRMEAR